jgi:outer membrane protein insertion porin family
MKKFIFLSISLLLPLLLFGQEMVEKIEIVGNERVTRETVLYYISTREGDYYNEDLLRRDFKVLWSTGFFSNIKMEREQGKIGKIIRIVVEENPIVKTITYKTGRKLKENDIVNKLKEKDEYILPYSYYNPHKVQRIQKTIEELLLEKGLHAGKVEVERNKIGKNEYEVLFNIKEGPKIKVGEVEFIGKSKLPDSVLKGAMKENKEHGVLTWVTGKHIFKQNKMADDLANIKKRLQEHGYMEATVGEPKIEEITKKSIFFRKQQMKKIVIPINAGYPYTVGEIKIEGNKIFSTRGLRTLIKFGEGDIYNIKLREKSIEKIGELYRNFGYLFSNIWPVESLDPKRKRVMVTFNIQEGELAFLNRLEFRGNTYTKDKVIRREMLLKEGDVFRLEWFKNSILRIRQLGLVDLEKEPEFKHHPEDPTQIDVVVPVKELQRNNVQFTAGYSGYEGTFIALSYSTVNFLGAGENLELVFQHGKRVKNYTFGFTEPYFLDLPMNLGFNIYNRWIYYYGLFTRRGKGADLMVGGRLKGYSRANLTYSYEYISIDIPDDGYTGDPYYDPYSYYSWEGSYHVSSLSPSIYRSTIDSPLTPSRGALYMASCKFAGNFLGGDVSLIKPRLEWSFFHPLVFNHVVGLHLEYQYIRPIKGSPIPIWEKFYLGGERSIRGYEIYTVGPRVEGRNIGGEKSIVLNAEYIIPVGGPLYAIFFYDAGNAYARDEKMSTGNMFTSSGLELRIFVPALRVPFRLIFAYNNRKIYVDDSNFAIRFAIGTTF